MLLDSCNHVVSQELVTSCKKLLQPPLSLVCIQRSEACLHAPASALLATDPTDLWRMGQGGCWHDILHDHLFDAIATYQRNCTSQDVRSQSDLSVIGIQMG